jgi:hypothetical protein
LGGRKRFSAFSYENMPSPYKMANMPDSLKFAVLVSADVAAAGFSASNYRKL